MPDNLVQPVMGKAACRVVIEMDAKGVATIGAHVIDPFGKENSMAPTMLGSILAKMSSVVAEDIHRAYMRGKAVENGDTKQIITS